MAKLTALVLLLALGLVSTVSARHLLFNVGAYSDPTQASVVTTTPQAATSADLPAIALPTLSQLKAFFDALPHPAGATNIFDALAPAPAPSDAAAPAPAMMAGAAPAAGLAPSVIASGPQT